MTHSWRLGWVVSYERASGDYKYFVIFRNRFLAVLSLGYRDPLDSVGTLKSLPRQYANDACDPGSGNLMHN